MLNKKHILCFCPVVGDTKDAKRIDILQKAGFDVTVIAFNREFFVSRLPKCEIVILESIENGKYGKRLGKMLKSLLRLRQYVKKCDIIYAMSPDLAIMAFIASGGKKPLVLDLADIRRIQVSSSISGKLVRMVDRFLATRCKLIVVTSKGFITEYYSKTLKKEIKNYFLLENKVDYRIPPPAYSEPVLGGKKLRIGYFGVLRDKWTIQFLNELLVKFPGKYEVYAAGINMLYDLDITELEEKVEDFHFIGPYKSPDDLEKLYAKVDVIAIFYPEYPFNRNWYEASRICRSNRFYEACFFRKPMLSFSFCEDGKEINNLKIGLTFTSYNISESLLIAQRELNYCNLSQWRQNLKSLPSEVYLFHDEHVELAKKLRATIKS